MTKEEFIAGYCARSKITREKFDSFAVALPCACGDDECKGWAVVKNEDEMVALHMELYAPRA